MAFIPISCMLGFFAIALEYAIVGGELLVLLEDLLKGVVMLTAELTKSLHLLLKVVELSFVEHCHSCGKSIAVMQIDELSITSRLR